MAKSKPEIPAEMTIEQASEFWDQHNLFQFENANEVKVEFQIDKKRYVGISERLFAKIQAYAKKKRLQPDELILEWLSEKANQLD